MRSGYIRTILYQLLLPVTDRCAVLCQERFYVVTAPELNQVRDRQNQRAEITPANWRETGAYMRMQGVAGRDEMAKERKGRMKYLSLQEELGIKG